MQSIASINKQKSLYSFDEIDITKSTGIHESVFKSSAVLKVISEMVKRGDSQETIEWVLEQTGY